MNCEICLFHSYNIKYGGMDHTAPSNTNKFLITTKIGERERNSRLIHWGYVHRQYKSPDVIAYTKAVIFFIYFMYIKACLDIV